MYVCLPYHEKRHTYRLPSLDSITSHLKDEFDAMDIDIDDG